MHDFLTGQFINILETNMQVAYEYKFIFCCCYWLLKDFSEPQWYEIKPILREFAGNLQSSTHHFLCNNWTT